MSTAPQRLTNATFNNPFVFSPCSVQYFRNYLAYLTSYVLYFTDNITHVRPT